MLSKFRAINLTDFVTNKTNFTKNKRIRILGIPFKKNKLKVSTLFIKLSYNTQNVFKMYQLIIAKIIWTGGPHMSTV